MGNRKDAKMKMTMRHINILNHAVRLAALTIVLLGGVCGNAKAQQQEYYTLTNGNVYFYDGLQADFDWADRYHIYPRGFNKHQGWAEVHPYGGMNLTQVTEKGEQYLMLDTANVKVGHTNVFSPLCVWKRTGTTGYYYQEWNGYYYYLIGNADELTIEKMAPTDATTLLAKWYDWDFGVALTVTNFIDGSPSKSYYWAYYDTAASSWDMSCISYERPNDRIFEDYDSVAHMEDFEYNWNIHGTYYCPVGDEGVEKKMSPGAAALFMPIEVEEHGIELAEIGAGLGLQSLALQYAEGGAPVSAIKLKDSMLINLNVVEADGSAVGVTPPYTKYTERTFIYGINTNWERRVDDQHLPVYEYGKAGLTTDTVRYYYQAAGDAAVSEHQTAPVAEMRELKVKTIHYSINNSALRFLTLDTTGCTTDPTAKPVLKCIGVPAAFAEVVVTATVTYTNGAQQTKSIKVATSQYYERTPMPQPQNGPVIAGYVVGGARMANVVGNTSVTVHRADSIYSLYGGNDIAGWVQGQRGATIQLGTEHTDASHPVHIGYVYGGGCGYYAYQNPYDAATEAWAGDDSLTTTVSYGQYCFNGKVYPWMTPSSDIASATPVVDKVFSYNPATGIDYGHTETGNNGDGTVPYIKTAHITVGIPMPTPVDNSDEAYLASDSTMRSHNDYILIDTVFGGGENSFIGVTSNEITQPENGVTIDIHGGTIFSVFGGNNYGGAVAQTATVFVNVHDTKLLDSDQEPSDLTYFTGYGREYGIRNLFGGGNLVESSHAHVEIKGGMIDTCYLGGNRASVLQPIGIVDCKAVGHTNSHGYDGRFIMTNPTYPLDLVKAGQINTANLADDAWVDANLIGQYGPDNFTPEVGNYNIRALFGGNNQAPMNNLAVIQLNSGGVSSVYGGGNAGDMRWGGGLSIPMYIDLMAQAIEGSHLPYPQGVGAIVSSLHDSKIICDYIFGGCRMANVDYSSGLYLAGGVFGYVKGGNDISGDVGSTKGDYAEGKSNGAYVIMDSSVLVIGDVVGGSDGYYHCDNGSGHYDSKGLTDNYNGLNYDPFDEYIGMLMPTHNNTNVCMKRGVVLGSLYGGGAHSNVGFNNTGNTGRRLVDGVETTFSPIGGIQNGSVHLYMSGGRVVNNVYGGGYMSAIYGLAYLQVGGSTRIDGALYAGNDFLGKIDNFGAYYDSIPATTNNGDLRGWSEYKASNGQDLNIQEGSNWNARYSAYLLLSDSVRIKSVYGSGNGDYDYEGADKEYVCADGGNVNRPLQSSTFIDINTASGYIDTVFGGGNGIGVRDNVTVLLNCKQNTNQLVGTIFGGNNKEDMTGTCVPQIVLNYGRAKNVFGGGNSGNMLGRTTQKDICGNEVKNVASYIRLEKDEAIIDDSIFGGCCMANVDGMAYIDMRKGNVNYIYGGNDIAGNVYGNTRIDVSGGTVAHIYGGSNGRYDYYQRGDQTWDIYKFNSPHDDANKLATGNATGRPFVDSTAVNLYGGTINTDVFGGGAMGDCRLTSVVVNDQICPGSHDSLSLIINGSVFGGGEGNWQDLNAERHGNVTLTDDGNGATYVHLHHATHLSTATAYGGGKGGDVQNTHITAYSTWDQPFEAIYGGCWGSDVYSTAYVVMEGASDPGAYTAYNVYGGNDFTGTVYKTDMKILDGRYGDIYGGGNGDYPAKMYSGDTTGYTVYSGTYPTDATDQYVDGASRSLQVPNNEKTEINFENGIVEGNLYGGGKLGTTMRLKRTADGTDFDDFGGASKKYNNTEAHTNIDDYSSIIVNVKGGTFNNNIYAGGHGASGGQCIVYGLKVLNIMNGTKVAESVYGGSENVNDGYANECDSTGNSNRYKINPSTGEQYGESAFTATTMRPSSILNIVGGTVKSHVFGCGYLGDTYGSAYVNIGLDAVESCPVWTDTVNGTENAYAAFKPGATDGHIPALIQGEVQLQGSVYGGANWGDNVGNADFSKPGFYGGKSRIIIDGNKYNTYMDDAHVSLPQMNISNSVIGSGTSVAGGDVYNRIDIRNYGAVDPNSCKATRELRAIQRADAVYLRNTAIDYTGSTDAISAFLSQQYTINRVDTLNCRGYNVIDVEATMTNINTVNFYYETGTEHNGNIITDADWVLVDNQDIPTCLESEPCSACGEATSLTLCDQLTKISRDQEPINKQTALVMNNGINVDLISPKGAYAAVNGFAFIVAQSGTNAVITARSKYGTTNINDGGFLPVCSDSSRKVDGYTGTLVHWSQPGFDNTESWEYRYDNYGETYRVWSIGQGIRRRYAVIQAHSNPTRLEENKRITLLDTTDGSNMLYNFAIAKSKLVLPPTSPGNYYKIDPMGVVIYDENSEMRLTDMSYRLKREWDSLTDTWRIDTISNAKPYVEGTDANKMEPDANGGWQMLDPTAGGSLVGVTNIHTGAGERQYFGLMMQSGENFSTNAPKSMTGWIDGSTISGNAYTNLVSNFATAQVGAAQNASPELDLYLLYNNDFAHTLVGTVNFTLNEYRAVPKRANYDGSNIRTNTGDIVGPDTVWIDSNLNAPIEIEITISTILQDFNSMEYEVLAMYNEGANDLFSRKVVLPATLQHRELYLETVTWMPTSLTSGTGNDEANGDTIRSAINPDWFYMTDSIPLIKNQEDGKHSYFGMSIQPVDNISNTLVSAVGWHSKREDTVNLYTAVFKGATHDVIRTATTNDEYYKDETHTINSAYVGKTDGAGNPLDGDHGLKIGELDGRGEAAINVLFNYDGSRLYNAHHGKGYVGKVVLGMVSYTGGKYDEPNRFNITINVKTRDRGDTIYITSRIPEGGPGHTLTTGTAKGAKLATEEDFVSHADKVGKSPDYYLSNIYEALVRVYQEGDVIAIIDTLNISGGDQVLIKGMEYMPIPIIRYDGHHHLLAGEEHVYRGPMFVVSGQGTVLTARCIDFKGTMVGKTVAGTGATYPDGVHKLLYNAIDTDDVKYSDTNMAYGPIIAVKDGATVLLQNGVIVRENYNGYTGDNAMLNGTISVTDGGTLSLINNVTIKNNLVVKQDSPSNHPLSGAVYLDGGTIELKQSNLSTAVLIDDNYVYDPGSSDKFWSEHTTSVDGTDKLIHYDFNSTAYNKTSDKTKANVLLVRTEPTTVPDSITAAGTTAVAEYKDMTDQKSEMITFGNYALPSGSHIGVSKWFPDLAGELRDTIRIVYQGNATHLGEADDDSIFFSDNPEFFTFYNYGVNSQRLYLARCATFKFQLADGVPMLAGSSVYPGDALQYGALTTATCPTGGDTMIFRIQGGFFPYEYTWHNNVTNTDDKYRKTTGSNVEMDKLIASHSFSNYQVAVADTFYTNHVDMRHDQLDEELSYTITGTDASKHCTLTKNVKIRLHKNTVDETPTKFAKDTNTYDEWTDIAHATANTVGDTARGLRQFKAIKITPRVWSPNSGFIAVAVPGTENILVGDDVNNNPLADLSFCEGDIISLFTAPKPGEEFIMWDFDPYYNPYATYMVPPHSETVTAYFGPTRYWIDTISSTSIARAALSDQYYYDGRPMVEGQKASYVTTYNDDVHIYDERGLAWFISVVNGINGTQAREFYFNNVYIHKKSDGTPYDMSEFLWTPVGTTQHPFRGYLIGVDSEDTCTTPLVNISGSDTTTDYVVIKSVIANEPNADYVGFFGHIESARIIGIQLTGALVRGAQYSAAMAADSRNSKIAGCKVDSEEDDATATIITTHYVSGGLVAKSENDSLTKNLHVGAKFVGDAVYTGGMVGTGKSSKVYNNYTYVNIRNNALYQGSIAGSMDGVAPTNRLFRAKTSANYGQIVNNYARVKNDGRPERVGGVAGYSKNTVIENNYVYGDLTGSAVSGAVAAVADQGTNADYNYYETGSTNATVGQQRSGASVATTVAFKGSGNQVALASEAYGVDNLTRALNRWVRDHGNGDYLTWRSDLDGRNGGYPVFGTPDLIPVSNTIAIHGCDSIIYDGRSYTDGESLTVHVVDSVEMIDSTSTLFFYVGHSSYESHTDTGHVGMPYSGYGFYLSPTETELLRSTLDAEGRATIVLTDTLSTSTGCDSIVSLTITFFGNTDIPEVTDEPTAADIHVYPNPTTSVVNVEADGLQHVELYDNDGRTLADYTTADGRSVRFDVFNLSSGIYYLRVHAAGNVTIQKLIKK